MTKLPAADDDTKLRSLARAHSDASAKLIKLKHKTIELSKKLTRKSGEETEEDVIYRQVLAEELAIALRDHDYLTDKMAKTIRPRRFTFDPFNPH